MTLSKNELKYITQLASSIHKACKIARKSSIIRQAYWPDLNGACAIASFGLWEKLLLSKYDVTLVYGKFGSNNMDHCWVEYNNWIIDPTYSQFSDQDILLTNDYNKYYVKYKHTEAINYIWEWEEQSPKHYYFTWNRNKCKLHYHESLLDECYII